MSSVLNLGLPFSFCPPPPPTAIALSAVLFLFVLRVRSVPPPPLSLSLSLSLWRCLAQPGTNSLARLHRQGLWSWALAFWKNKKDLFRSAEARLLKYYLSALFEWVSNVTMFTKALMIIKIIRVDFSAVINPPWGSRRTYPWSFPRVWSMGEVWWPGLTTWPCARQQNFWHSTLPSFISFGGGLLSQLSLRFY